MVNALLVSPNGNVKMVQYEGYLGMKALLNGGYIESVRFGPVCIAMCDEDGKQKGLPRNEKATMLAQLVGTCLGKHDHFVGPVLCSVALMATWQPARSRPLIMLRLPGPWGVLQA